MSTEQVDRMQRAAGYLGVALLLRSVDSEEDITEAPADPSKSSRANNESDAADSTLQLSGLTADTRDTFGDTDPALKISDEPRGAVDATASSE